MKGLGLVLVVVLVLVLVMGPGSSSSSSRAPVVDTSFDAQVRGVVVPAGRPSSGDSGLVDKCHQGFEAASGAVASKYGAPSSTGQIGAKVNPYYYACDAGGYVIEGAKAVGHFFGGLF